ncbi:MAG: DUF4364 family protein [Clostridia bacterium]|nr:DUF4364 family protein [Clostridia bacterium]
MPETFHSSEQVKVFILYLLEKIGYPLEYNDLASIVLRDGFVDYFDFVKNFHELLENGHICAVAAGDPLPGEDAPAIEAAESVRSAQADAGADTEDFFTSLSPAPENPEPEVPAAEPDEPDPDAGWEEEESPGPQEPEETKPAPVERPSAYVVTSTGRTIARGLADDLLLTAVREKSYISAMRHLSLEKRKAVWNHSVEKDGEGYIFHCSIRDCDGLAFRLELRADSFPQAERMRMNFEDKPDVVYRGIVAMVTGNVNYLFEK